MSKIVVCKNFSVGPKHKAVHAQVGEVLTAEQIELICDEDKMHLEKHGFVKLHKEEQPKEEPKAEKPKGKGSK